MDILQDLLPRLDYFRILEGLEPRRHGNQINVVCPKCRVHDAYIRTDGPQGPGRAIICRRDNKCGKTTPLLEIATGHAHLEGGDFIEGLKKLAIMGGATFNLSKYGPGFKDKQAALNNRLHALEAIKAECTRCMANDVYGAEPTAYMKGRGFDPAPFGYIHHVKQLGSLGIPHDQLAGLGFMYRPDDGQFWWNDLWNRRVIVPMTDRYGRLVGFSGRTIDADAKKKYLNTTGLDIKALGATELSYALGKQKDGRLIATEGYLDPFKARQYGIHNVVGIGSTGSVLSPERWQQLYEWGVKELALCLDSDRAGSEGLRKAMDNHDKAKKKPELYVISVDAEGWGKKPKDLDELLDLLAAHNALDTWNVFYRDRVHTDIYRARMLAAGIEFSPDETNNSARWAYIQKCMDYDRGIHDPMHSASLATLFWPEVQRLTGLDMSAIMAVREELRRQKQKDERGRAVTALIRDTEGRLAKEGADVALEQLAKGVEKIGVEYQPVYLSTVSETEQLLQQDEYRLRELARGTGARIDSMALPTLDAYLAGLRGLILLAGASNIGKTIFLVQVAVEALIHQPGLSCLFASLEMKPSVLRNRIRSYLTGLSPSRIIELYKPGIEVGWSECGGITGRAQCTEQKPCVFCELRRLEAAHNTMLDIGDRMRFLHETEPNGFQFTVDNLLNERTNLLMKTGCSRTLGVFDYMDIWEVEGRDSVDEDKRRTADFIKLRDKGNDDPWLVVSEVVKPEGSSEDQYVTERDLIGSGRKVYRADQGIIVNRFNREMLWRHFAWTGTALVSYDEPHTKSKKDLQKPEVEQEIRTVRKLLEQLGPAFPLEFNVFKVRADGGDAKKGYFKAMVHWYKNRITEGLKL